MAGCFGNDPYDKYLERLTDDYCNEMYGDDIEEDDEFEPDEDLLNKDK